MRLARILLPLTGVLSAVILLAGLLAADDSVDNSATTIAGWRGDGTGRYPTATPPTSWSERDIAWRVRMPARSAASPIVVGKRVFVTADRTDLLCLRRSDGKVLWLRSNTYYHALTDEEFRANPALREKGEPLAARLNALNEAVVRAINDGTVTPRLLAEKQAAERALANALKELDPALAMPDDHNVHGDFGTSVPTPCSDGQSVYAWFGHGVAASYDLDGNRRWVRRANEGTAPEHGFTASPVLAAGLLIAMRRDIVAFNAWTGKTNWRYQSKARTAAFSGVYGSLSVFQAKGGSLVVAANGNVIRAADGRPLVTPNWIDAWPTPIIERGVLYQTIHPKNGATHRLTGCLVSFRLPEKADLALTAATARERFARVAQNRETAGLAPVASLLYHQGLLYSVDQRSWLRVFDLKAGGLAYEQQLDATATVKSHTDPGLCASPALAGRHIFVLGHRGTVWVIQPGAKFKLAAKNFLVARGPAEQFLASPTFAGRDICIRSTSNLFCIRTP